ncbi:hypothetical protein [Campylobacter sp. RM16192]|uniref:hypothetical protein n=1 Tax=Campylobacter sp. RM16192 TaxID=1660080 RepID=UPI00145225B6|nr:hypothetical protein [Campylobacter sp. RM16192]QCD51976.1 hypothetical protein CDOMC_0316 [Campylobacter sp. RM16192]
MRNSRHKKTLLKIMLEQGRVTAGQKNLGISNANQYLGDLKREGVIKDIQANGERFKWWYIVDFDKAKKRTGA